MARPFFAPGSGRTELESSTPQHWVQRWVQWQHCDTNPHGIPSVSRLAHLGEDVAGWWTKTTTE